VGDIGMHYVQSGQGEPLVLIMGLGADHTSWGFQVPALSQAYRVIAFDNRGAGQTDQPDVPYTIRGMAADTVGLLDALGIDRAHVAGASMGGMIAQEIALTYPDRVLSLQLHCTIARPDAYLLTTGRAWLKMRAALSREEFARALTVWLFSPTTFRERPEFIEALLQNALANPYPASPTGYRRQSEAVAAHDTLDRLRQIRCPALVTVGADDVVTAPRFARAMCERIPHAELVTFENAGHAHFLEAVGDFNRVCLDFLSRSRAT
jgi:pimeloyl-ACP methyl ester carboxylesterase